MFFTGVLPNNSSTATSNALTAWSIGKMGVVPHLLKRCISCRHMGLQLSTVAKLFRCPGNLGWVVAKLSEMLVAPFMCMLCGTTSSAVVRVTFNNEIPKSHFYFQAPPSQAPLSHAPPFQAPHSHAVSPRLHPPRLLFPNLSLPGSSPPKLLPARLLPPKQ